MNFFKIIFITFSALLFFSFELDAQKSFSFDFLQKKIKELKENETLNLESGTYEFRNFQYITIRSKNIRIQGADNGETIFKFSKVESKYAGFIDVDSSHNIEISNITFDGNNNSSYKSPIEIGACNSNIIIKNCRFNNLFNKYGQIYAISISAYNVRNFKVLSCNFKNISSIGDKVVGTAKGMSGGILIISNKSKKTDVFSTGTIENNIFDSIFLKRVEDEIDYDADGIRFFVSPDSLYSCENSKGNVLIKNNKFINVEKSAVKIQSFPGVSVINNEISSEMKVQFMLAGIRVYGDYIHTKNILIEGNNFVGNLQRCAILNGGDILFSNNTYNSRMKSKYPTIQIGEQQISKGIVITDFNFKSKAENLNFTNKSDQLIVKNIYIFENEKLIKVKSKNIKNLIIKK